MVLTPYTDVWVEHDSTEPRYVGFAGKKTYSQWQRIVTRIQNQISKETHPPTKKKLEHDLLFCERQAFFNAQDLSQSFLHYTKKIVGRDKSSKRHGTVESDRRRDFFPFVTKSNKYKMLQAARGSWKSSIAVVDFVSWWIARDYILHGISETRVLLASEVSELAKRNSKWILRLMQTRRFVRLAGSHRSRNDDQRPWGVTEMVSALRTEAMLGDPTLMPMGINAERVGFHCDLIVCDDLQAQRSSSTMDMIENNWDFFQLLQSIAEDHTYIHLICTRWHEDDIYQRIEDNNEILDPDEKYTILKIPARDVITLKDDQGETIEQQVTLNFPQILPEKRLNHLQSTQSAYIFSCQYELQPRPDQDKKFHPNMVKMVMPYMLRRRINWFITCDFAWSEEEKFENRKRKKADYTVILTVGIDEDWNFLITDWFRERCSKYEAIREVDRQYQALDRTGMILMQKFDNKAIKETIEQYCFNEQVQLPVEWVTYPAKQSKLARIENALEPAFRAGKVFCTSTMDWFWKEELLPFPQSKHFDGLDALCNVHKEGKPPAQTPIKYRDNPELKKLQILMRGGKPGQDSPEEQFEKHNW